MDVLALEGKNYVKSSVIARELGYTSDYVGQLCRSGKVEAKLFGKTWYVEESSIAGHKRTRYRSSKAVTKRVLHTDQVHEVSSKILIHTEVKVSPSTVFTKEGNFYTHTKRQNRVGTSYSEDSTGLIPEPSKMLVKKQLHVGLADAHKVGVASPKDEYTFEVPTLPEIRFKGRLTVSAVEEGVGETESSAVGEHDQKGEEVMVGSAVHIHPKDVSRFVSIKPKNKVISSATHSKKSEQHLVVSEDQGAKSEIIPILKVAPKAVTSIKSYYVLSSFALILSVLLSVMCIILDAKITVTASTVTTDYHLRFQNITDVFFQLKNIF